jgi:hypothetical protein
MRKNHLRHELRGLVREVVDETEPSGIAYGRYSHFWDARSFEGAKAAVYETGIALGGTAFRFHSVLLVQYPVGEAALMMTIAPNTGNIEKIVRTSMDHGVRGATRDYLKALIPTPLTRASEEDYQLAIAEIRHGMDSKGVDEA